LYAPGQPQLGEADKRRILLDGVRDIETGLLYNILASLLIAIGFSMIAAAFYAAITGGPNAAAERLMAAGLMATVMVFLIIIGLIVAIVGLFKIYSGFSTLSTIDKNYSIAVTGIKLSIGSLGLVVLASLALTLGIAASSIGLIVIGIGLILIGLLGMFVGAIMLLIGFWRLSALEGGSLIQAGIILIVLGIIFSDRGGLFLSFAGTVLIYLGVKKIRENLEIQAAEPSPPSTSSYQPGGGTGY